jgi:predicted porin
VKKEKTTSKLIVWSLLLLCFNAFGQESVDLNNEGSIQLGLEVGYAANFMGGSARKEFKNLVNDVLGDPDGELSLEANAIVNFSPLIGVYAEYQLKPEIKIRGGLRYMQRGNTIEITGEDRDSQFQFDQMLKYKEQIDITTIELPISAFYQYTDKIKFGGGVIIGTSIESSIQSTVSLSTEVIINGEFSEDFSTSDTLEDADLVESTSNPYFGFSVSAEYAITPKLNVNLTILKTSNYLSLGYGDLSDTSVSLGITYSFLKL